MATDLDFNGERPKLVGTVDLRFGDPVNGVDLDFTGTSQPKIGTVDLEFGTPQNLVPRQVRFVVTLASPLCRVVGRITPPPREMGLRASLAAPRMHVRADYDNRVERSPACAIQACWEEGAQRRPMTAAPWQSTLRLPTFARERWQDALAVGHRLGIRLGHLDQLHAERFAAWRQAPAVNTGLRSSFEHLVPGQTSRRLLWDEAGTRQHALLEDWVNLAALGKFLCEVWQEGGPRRQDWRTCHGDGIARRFAPCLPWQEGRFPPPGLSTPPGGGELPPSPNDFTPDLDFRCTPHQAGLAWRPALLLAFGVHPCPGEDKRTNAVSILKVYFVSNQVEIVRLPGREPIPVKSIQIGIDVDSWAWGFTASLPGTALELIEPTAQGPVEIEISINGATWVMLVEGYDMQRAFGQSGLSIRGRSTAAYLAEPYTPKRSFAPNVPFTARQLAKQELTRAGLVTGFSLDWRLADWLVPGGAVSFEDASPIAVINRIAQSAGGFVNAHPHLQQLAAQPRYPEPPWQWGAMPPDAILPLDVVKTLNLRWQEKPAFNAVYVSGERAGVVAQVKRSGTAGDSLATMVVDPLITHADVARSRGIAILSDTGKQALVTLELPMLPELGLLSPGLMLSIGAGSTAWRGLVRSTQVSAQWSEALTVRQSTELERHFL